MDIAEFGSGLTGAMLGAVVGGVTTWLAARWQLRKELQYGYDKDLRTERVSAYRELWKVSELLPRYHPAGNPTGADLEDAIEQFHRWFFDTGGLFLSDQARSAYFGVMDELRRIANRRGATEIDSHDVKTLLHLGEELRAQLAFDVGAGQPPELTSGRITAAPKPPMASK
jgi:hypothetical protein